MPTFVKLCDVDVPVDVENFITPDWKDVLDFHAKWVRLVDWRRWGDPWPFQPYMLEFANQLERLGKQEDMGNLRVRTADQWMQRCMQHYGLGFLSHYASLKAHENIGRCCALGCGAPLSDPALPFCDRHMHDEALLRAWNEL